MVRWIVGTVHGRVTQRYKLIHHVLDNRLHHELPIICKIIRYLENRFGGLFWGHSALNEEILDRVEAREVLPNELGKRIEQGGWMHRPSTLRQIDAADLMDFPRLTERESTILASGTVIHRDPDWPRAR